MKTLTATDLKTRTGEFFEVLLSDGKVTLAMDMTGLDQYAAWDSPKVGSAPLKEIIIIKQM